MLDRVDRTRFVESDSLRELWGVEFCPALRANKALEGWPEALWAQPGDVRAPQDPTCSLFGGVVRNSKVFGRLLERTVGVVP